MRKEAITSELSALAFDFFYWFSRFEFCLKENGYLKNRRHGARAEPGWDNFVEQHFAHYKPSDEAAAIMASPPEAQVILNGALGWRPVGLEDCTSDLEKVARLVKTVRNNLFHGGKHGGADWDNPVRTQHLLATGKKLLSQLADLGSFQDDYKRRY